MEIRVNTTFARDWNTKPYLSYDCMLNEYFLVMKSYRDARKIKHFMNLAKKRIKREMSLINGVIPIVKFEIVNFKKYVKGNN